MHSSQIYRKCEGVELGLNQMWKLIFNRFNLGRNNELEMSPGMDPDVKVVFTWN